MNIKLRDKEQKSIAQLHWWAPKLTLPHGTWELNGLENASHQTQNTSTYHPPPTTHHLPPTTHPHRHGPPLTDSKCHKFDKIVRPSSYDSKWTRGYQMLMQLDSILLSSDLSNSTIQQQRALWPHWVYVYVCVCVCVCVCAVSCCFSMQSTFPAFMVSFIKFRPQDFWSSNQMPVSSTLPPPCRHVFTHNSCTNCLQNLKQIC